MYKVFTWFTVGYLAHKHGVPVLTETLRRMNETKKSSESGSLPRVTLTRTKDAIRIAAEDVSTINALWRELSLLESTNGFVYVSDLTGLIGVTGHYLDVVSGWWANSDFMTISDDGLRLTLAAPVRKDQNHG